MQNDPLQIPQTQPDLQNTSSGRKFAKTVMFILLFALLVLGGFYLYKLYGKNLKLPGRSGNPEIVWWSLWEDESILRPIIDEYEDKNPQVKVKYLKQSPQDYRERLTNSFAKGQGPDIFRFHNSWVPMFRNELGKVPSSVMNSADFAGIFYPVAQSDLITQGGISGIPLEYDGLTLYINESIFDSAGKNPPKTWYELRQTAIELTSKDESGFIVQAGAALGRTENVDHWQEILALMFLQSGVSPAKPAGKAAENALAFFTNFSNIDGVWDETLPESTLAFASGRLAMYFGPSWRYFEIQNKNPELKFKTVPLPQLPKDNPNQPTISYATYWVEGVWEKSKNKDEAWKFLKFLSEKDALEKIYQNAAKTRAFGEPYPRQDMAELLKDHPILGSITSLAPDSQSWYLASSTFDGNTGINSQVNKLYEEAVSSVNEGTIPARALDELSKGITSVLSQYGITSK